MDEAKEDRLAVISALYGLRGWANSPGIGWHYDSSCLQPDAPDAIAGAEGLLARARELQIISEEGLVLDPHFKNILKFKTKGRIKEGTGYDHDDPDRDPNNAPDFINR